jgi:hypothetical protein
MTYSTFRKKRLLKRYVGLNTDVKSEFSTPSVIQTQARRFVEYGFGNTSLLHKYLLVWKFGFQVCFKQKLNSTWKNSFSVCPTQFRRLTKAKQAHLSYYFSSSVNKRTVGVFLWNVYITFMVLSKDAYVHYSYKTKKIFPSFLLCTIRICLEM